MPAHPEISGLDVSAITVPIELTAHPAVLRLRKRFKAILGGIAHRSRKSRRRHQRLHANAQASSKDTEAADKGMHGTSMTAETRRRAKLGEVHRKTVRHIHRCMA